MKQKNWIVQLLNEILSFSAFCSNNFQWLFQYSYGAASNWGFSCITLSLDRFFTEALINILVDTKFKLKINGERALYLGSLCRNHLLNNI